MNSMERKEIEGILRGLYYAIKHLDTPELEKAVTEGTYKRLGEISWQLRMLNKDMQSGYFWKDGEVKE